MQPAYESKQYGTKFSTMHVDDLILSKTKNEKYEK